MKPLIGPAPLKDQLNMLFHYDPETGELRWREFLTTGSRKWGKLATKKYAQYLSVNIAARNFPAHRIVWCMHYGIWPPGHVTHLNGDRTDNRIENLAADSMTNLLFDTKRQEAAFSPDGMDHMPPTSEPGW